MGVGEGRGDAASRGAFDKSLHDEERFVDLFERVRLFRKGGC